MRCLARSRISAAEFLYQFLLFGTDRGCCFALRWVCHRKAALVAGYGEQCGSASLPQPRRVAVLKAAAAVSALLRVSAFWPLLHAAQGVAAARAAPASSHTPTSTGMVYGVAVLVLAGLFLWQAGSMKLGLTMLAWAARRIAGFFAWLAWLLLRGMARL